MFKNVGLHSMIDFNMQNMQNACEKNAQIWKEKAENVHKMCRICFSVCNHCYDIFCISHTVYTPNVADGAAWAYTELYAGTKIIPIFVPKLSLFWVFFLVFLSTGEGRKCIRRAIPSFLFIIRFWIHFYPHIWKNDTLSKSAWGYPGISLYRICRLG